MKTNVQVQGSGDAVQQGSVGQAQRLEERPDQREEPRVVDEICVEELAIDGICGVY